MGLRKAAWALAIMLGFMPLPVAASQYELRIPQGMIEPDIPPDDSLTIAKIDLGRRLFMDARLSADGRTSCASCHVPSHGFAGKTKLDRDAKGRLLRRHTPSVLNSGYLTSTDWDFRFTSLEQQALEAFHDWGDMGIDVDQALDRIDTNPSDAAAFKEVFGHAADTLRWREPSQLTNDRSSRAIHGSIATCTVVMRALCPGRKKMDMKCSSAEAVA